MNELELTRSGISQYQKCNISFQSYNSSQSITSNCADILFYNTGTSTLFVNGLPLTSGQFFSPDLKQGEIDKTDYFLTFGNAGVPSAFVIRKLYLL